ncbi:LLM class flavin-dependent oxidoreductase [Chitinophaga sp. MM2321]|uniref:LLM class flavin-dependent oxidoreductase n=1 Tax=Chitinophaga sp. MM2321 TaxID=3137178 RepID=UPI0032D59096
MLGIAQALLVTMFLKTAMTSEKLIDIPLSILDLVPIIEGGTIETVLKNSLILAQQAEKFGYNRYWLAEHHNMETVASSATAVLIGYIAGGTKTMRVGSGGIMLPNHAPLVVAEQFGTLASLYPNRIDLGLGRAPGTDQLTAKALRRSNLNTVLTFPDDVIALQTYFSADNKKASVRAIPGEGLDIPIWILGSSTDSARLAANFGLPYAFASHFAPTHLEEAVHIYRRDFRPSVYLEKPYLMACTNAVVADTNAEAERLVTSYYQLVVDMISGNRRKLQPPVDTMEGRWSDYEEASVKQMTRYSFIGDVEKIKAEITRFQQQFQLDEIMFTSNIYDLKARVRSYELLMLVNGGVKKEVIQ